MIEPQNLSNKNKFQIDTSKSPVESVLSFLDRKLPEFPSVFKKKTSLRKIKAEVKISQELCIFLNTANQLDEISLFLFQPEWNYEDSQRSSDFGVIDVKSYHSSSEPTQAFFVIEAKRLPTTGKDSKTGESREREYVEGNLGGIERYKRGHHAKGLSQSGMIGYVQKNNCSHWQIEINSWINDLVNKKTGSNIYWDSKDCLSEISNFNTNHSTIQKYTSKNTRTINSVKDIINLYHYLIDLK